MYYAPPEGFEALPVPNTPTREQVEAAISLIDSNLFRDFPFVSDADKAHAWAFLLLGFMRDMVTGPTPCHWFDKSTAGTGASKLASVIGIVHCGINIPFETAPQGRKRRQA